MLQQAGTDAFTFLRALDMLHDVSDGELARVAGVSRMLSITKGKVIYWRDEEPSGLFLVRSGRVSLSRFTRTGRRVDVHILGPEDFFGLGVLLAEPENGSQAEAVDDCVLLSLSALDARRLLEHGPHVARRMIPRLARQLGSAEQQLVDIACCSVASRVAALLLRLGDGSEIVEGFSHEELASAVAADRVSITRALRQLESHGCVRNGRRRILLLDRRCLAQAVGAA